MAKKDKKAKLPKAVGGVKLPKQLRKSASVVAEIAQNPVAREIVSAALVAGASALARSKAKGKPAATDAKKPGEFGALIAQGQEIGSMITQGINAFLDALLKPADKTPAAAAEPAPAKPAPAKPAARRTAPKSAAPKTPAAKPAAAKPAAAKRAPARPRAKPAPKPKPAS